MPKPVERIALNAVVAVGASDPVQSSGHFNVTLQTVATGVTTGGTMKLQGSLDGTNWHDLATQSITANGQTSSTVSNTAFKFFRANLTARTDGTYTARIYATGFPGMV